jgi:ribosome maturation factor RimP
VGPAHFFFGPNPAMTDPLTADIQQQLSELDSELDVLAVERPGGASLRIFIDHPEGVDLARCEQVTHHLSHLLADYSLEVSSPGPKYRRSGVKPDPKESPQ